ncbi:MAG TPA: hypothetical protein VKF36_14865 [Syntrophorhabdales bacterium]|nr:hypothetical protein [Syntrophorhabdales bacterium]
MKFAEGLLYEAVMTALRCAAVGDGKGAAGYDLREVDVDNGEGMVSVHVDTI